jgi:hypothetical protein
LNGPTISVTYLRPPGWRGLGGLSRCGRKHFSATKTGGLTKILWRIGIEVRVLPRLYSQDLGVIITVPHEFAKYAFHEAEYTSYSLNSW